MKLQQGSTSIITVIQDELAMLALQWGSAAHMQCLPLYMNLSIPLVHPLIRAL